MQHMQLLQPVQRTSSDSFSYREIQSICYKFQIVCFTFTIAVILCVGLFYLLSLSKDSQLNHFINSTSTNSTNTTLNYFDSFHNI